jgi:hypothetical protein
VSRFHADLHVLSGAAADPVGGNGLMTGGTLLFNANQTKAVVRKLMVSTDTAMRIVIGMSDADGQRIRAGYFAGNGGAAPDVCVEVPDGGKVYLFHSAAGNVDVSIDGDLVDG